MSIFFRYEDVIFNPKYTAKLVRFCLPKYTDEEIVRGVEWQRQELLSRSIRKEKSFRYETPDGLTEIIGADLLANMRYAEDGSPRSSRSKKSTNGPDRMTDVETLLDA